MRRTIISLLALSCLATTALLAQDASLNDVRKLAHDSAKLEPELRHLTDDIGGRVPGTPAFQKAAEWAMATMREAGADNVRLEAFAVTQIEQTIVRETAPCHVVQS